MCFLMRGRHLPSQVLIRRYAAVQDDGIFEPFDLVIVLSVSRESQSVLEGLRHSYWHRCDTFSDYARAMADIAVDGRT
jgi:hypothetical protein